MVTVKNNAVFVNDVKIETRSDFLTLLEIDKKQVLEYRNKILNTKPTYNVPRTKKRN